MMRIERRGTGVAAKIHSLAYCPRESEGSTENVGRRGKPSEHSVRDLMPRKNRRYLAQLPKSSLGKTLMLLDILTSPSLKMRA
jgi:hypothetical protein